MRTRSWAAAFAVVAVVAAVLLLSAGPASSPDPQGDGPGSGSAPGGGAESGGDGPSPFPRDLQTAGRSLQDPELAELSGLAASRLHPGVLYGINDSGGGPVVYAIGADGSTVARLALAGGSARDWEALAPGRDADGSPVLWIGDIGDNLGNQARTRLIRIAEPAVLADAEVPWSEYWITYPDGPHNAEALAVDPRDGSISVITKEQGGPGGIYRAPSPLERGGNNLLQRVGEAPRGITDGAWELSPAGEPRLVVTDYWQLHRLGPDGWVSALAPLQLQREALAWPWLPDGGPNDRVLLGSEGAGSAIIAAEVP